MAWPATSPAKVHARRRIVALPGRACSRKVQRAGAMVAAPRPVCQVGLTGRAGTSGPGLATLNAGFKGKSARRHWRPDYHGLLLPCDDSRRTIGESGVHCSADRRLRTRRLPRRRGWLWRALSAHPQQLPAVGRGPRARCWGSVRTMVMRSWRLRVTRSCPIALAMPSSRSGNSTRRDAAMQREGELR